MTCAVQKKTLDENPSWSIAYNLPNVINLYKSKRLAMVLNPENCKIDSIQVLCPTLHKLSHCQQYYANLH